MSSSESSVSQYNIHPSRAVLHLDRDVSTVTNICPSIQFPPYPPPQRAIHPLTLLTFSTDIDPINKITIIAYVHWDKQRFCQHGHLVIHNIHPRAINPSSSNILSINIHPRGFSSNYFHRCYHSVEYHDFNPVCRWHIY